MKLSIDLIQSGLPDRYHLEKQLTEKSDRQTWLAYDQQEDKSVVLKILWFAGSSAWKNLTHFKREAQLLQQVSHNAIPTFLAYFDLQVTDRHGFVLVQEYIPARSLSQHRDDGRVFSEGDIKQIIEQVLDVLIYLHQQDPPILHRDIKPSNLLLGDRSAHSVGQIYLVDFGAAKSVTESIGKTLTVVGSYGYAPMEQFGGRAVPASDVYSLGATVIYLLTGRHPAELPQVDMTIQFEAATNVSLELKKWIVNSTQPFLDRRFSSAEVALENLRNPVNSKLSHSNSGPDGTKITCQKFDTFLQISQPISDRRRARATVLSQVTIRLMIWSCIIISCLSLMMVFALIGSIMHWSLSVVAVLGGFVSCYVTIRGWNQAHPISLPWLIRQEYQINKAGIRSEQWFLLKKTPRIEHMNRSDLKQVDRIPTHKVRCQTPNTHEIHIEWTDVPSKIELRAGEITFSFDKLKEPEIDWLCTELSDYLGIPIVTHTIDK